MVPNRLAFAGLAMACVAAAGVGGYVASRQNAVPAPVAATAAPTPAPPVATAKPSQPVQETEGVVGDVTKAPVEKAEPSKMARRSDAASSTEKAAGKVGVRETPARPAQSAAPAAPTLTSSWPSGAAAQPPVQATTPESVPAHAAEPIAEPQRTLEPQKTFEDLVVSADSVIGLQTEGLISSETARVEDRIDARVSRDVRVGDQVAIPAGSRALGNVTLVERGGKFKERARIGVRFHTLVLADGTRLPVSTETIYREGQPPSQASAQKIGGAAVGGAIIGAILGGAKGAAIGATAGAGGGAAAVAASDRSTVVLQPGTPMTVRILSPVTVTIEKN